MIHENGRNETFVLKKKDDEIKEGDRIQSLVVAHPKMTNITEVIMTYTKYSGWIYSGKDEWYIDRIEVLDSRGLM